MRRTSLYPPYARTFLYPPYMRRTCLYPPYTRTFLYPSLYASQTRTYTQKTAEEVQDNGAETWLTGT